MTKAIFGKKVGMTQVFTEDGGSVAVTVIEAKPCTVVQKRSTDKDGYEALQVGFGELRRGRARKSHAGQFHAARMQPTRYLKELRLADCSSHDVGSELTVEMFEAGERVDVVGTSKGKGFQGTIKRHGFHRGPMAHGSKSHRRPGSAGATDAARTFPGKKNPGQMGNERVKVQGLTVERVLADKNLLLVRGAVPGANGSYVEIQGKS